MACIVKAAEVVVVVVVVVVVLGGGHGGRCHAGHLAINCNSDTEITRSGEEKLIHSEEIRQARETVSENLYMVPLTGFEGVRAEVTTNMGTFTAWFPIMNHCPIGDSRWWQVLLEVKKHTSSTLTAKLAVHNCFLSCELITDARRTNGRDLKLHNLELFGRGASKWRTQRPESPCYVEKLANYPQKKILTSCTNPPPIGSASPPHSNTEQQPTHKTTQQNTHKTTQQNTHKTTQQNTHKTTQQNTHKTTQQNTHEILITTSPPVASSSVSESRAHRRKGLTSIQLGGVVVAVIVVIVMMMVVVLLIIRRRAQRENEQGSQLTHSIQEVNVSRNSLYESFDQYQQHSSGPGQGDGPADTQC